MIHLQPLPIFRTSDLVHYLTVAPQFLLHSFLALVLTLKRPGLYCDPFSERIQLYTESAEEAVRKLAAKGASTIEVIQSLCLLSLRDILVCQPYQAQMTIGTASRLEACRTQSATVSLDGLDRDLSLRCRWSVYILESIFSPRLCAAEELHVSGFNFPISSPVPPALHPTRNENYPSDLYNAYDSKNDFGIITYYTKMVSIWRHLSIWLNHIRLGKEEAPWLPESGYAKLVAKVYERDSQLPAKHLLRNVSFSNRSPIEVSEQHEYWVPWVLMQLQCHAYLAILNHPFIHLVAVRNCSKGSQSGMFLQQTLDSALFNSGWVFRFLQLCEGHQLDLCDPFLGHLIATVATIPWLLQFVEDEKISLKASQDLILCKSFLKRLSSLWPHISQKLEILERLQITAEYHRRDLSNNGRAIKFPPSLLWELLDPHICQMNSQKPSPTDEPVVEQAPDARIQITTHLTHPLAESQDAATFYDADVDVDQATLNVPEELEQMYIDDLFNDFMQTMSFNTTV
ncbi:hypothetical protein BGZ63DRAFT_382479 [Mariannaea sp. PMI_226]|nr:hypothetical protein BGZ63DRAFT_382479 [Mariannaea sp. PMI_226]